MKRSCLLLIALLYAARLLAAALPSDVVRLDAEACRKLVEAGKILSMMDLMTRVEQLSGGHMLDSVLLKTGDTYIYELEVAGIDGVVRTLYVNARTGALADF